MENWEKRFDETKFAKGGGACFECCDYEGMLDDLKSFISSELELAKQEERERIEKSFIDNSPAFLPPDCKRGYALASMVLKATVASLHQNNNEGGKE